MGKEQDMSRKFTWSEIALANGAAAMWAALFAWAFDTGFWGTFAAFDFALILILLHMASDPSHSRYQRRG